MYKSQAQIQENEIGVITPYSAQVDKINNEILKLYDDKILERGVTISTVDGFQGKEKDVIIISTVRSNPTQKIGFLRDVRRMNVAITRARKMLIIIGDENTIKVNAFIKNIIEKIKQKGKIILPENIDGEEISGRCFHKEFFYKSGVFKIENQKPTKSEAKKPTENEKISQTKNRPNKKEVKQEKLIEKTEAENLNKYWQEFCNDLLENSKSQINVFRKLNENEFKELVNFCESNRIVIKKNKKGYILTKQKDVENEVTSLENENDTFTQNDSVGQNEFNGTQKIEEVSKIRNDITTQQIESNSVKLGGVENTEFEPTKATIEQASNIIDEKNEQNTVAKKRKRNIKNKEQSTHFEEDPVELLLKQAQERQKNMEFCCFKNDEFSENCGKNIKILFQECKYCHARYCLQHALAEKHGCGDVASKFEKEKFREKPKTNYANFDGDLMKEKLKNKMIEEQKKRQTKPKKK